ncbi:hypothetical protein BGX24_002550 [Mortierella sp. AD032]|nr:hypothetical protein BGX24_002550 [Mortierella sp. AD032]
MTKENILFIGTVRHAKAQEAALAAKYNVHYAAPSRKELFDQLENAKREGITFKALYRGFASHYTLGRVDEQLLTALPSGLELIGSVGAGYDFVEYNMRHGLPHKPRIGRDPTNMTLGIVGMGGIGKAVAKRAQALGMKIVYHNRRPITITGDNEAFLTEATYLPTLDALLSTSDVVSIHVPLSPETRYLFRADQFSTMKAGSYLLNTSRGPVVDEEALVQALASGHIAGAGLDVFEHEPKVHPELLKNMDVALMPHLGAFTVETITKMEALTMENIDLFLSSGALLTPVNHVN